jgi:hypothetical protein
MAGVVGSNPTRPTILSLTHVGSSKLLGPLQRFAAALQLFLILRLTAEAFSLTYSEYIALLYFCKLSRTIQKLLFCRAKEEGRSD